MKQRGFYIAGGGVVMIVISFVVAISIINESGTNGGQFSLPDLLQGMFDEVSDNVHIRPNESFSFSFDASTDTQALLWGIQILNYESGDVAEITISNIYGDEFGKFRLNQPAMFETLKIEKSDIYNFNVKNTGSRQITTVMMFTKNPEESERLVDPNSPLSKTLMPLAISGIMLFVGIAVAIIGVIILIVDYRKKQSELI
ncbi:MAG: hypothetical protein QXW37_05460 [Candidatus Nitrosotenuis sp.]